MKLRDKFMTVCGACDGTGEYEEPIGGFENEVTYRLTDCGCENGKEFDWDKLYKEINSTKLKIEINQMSVDNHNQFMRDAIKENNEPLALICLRSLIEYENKVSELELYLAELEEL
jgi:hypothetical protein